MSALRRIKVRGVQFESWMEVLARVHPQDILDVALGALVVLEPHLLARPDVPKVFGRALLALDAPRELVGHRAGTPELATREAS